MTIPVEWLVRRVTYRAYVEKFLASLVNVPDDVRIRIEDRVAEVENKVRPRDEIWEWRHDGGDLSSAGGIAILRDGKMVECWREWIS